MGAASLAVMAWRSGEPTSGYGIIPADTQGPTPDEGASLQGGDVVFYGFSRMLAAYQLVLIRFLVSCRNGCTDTEEHCEHWASAGECEKNAAFMKGACQASCGVC